MVPFFEPKFDFGSRSWLVKRLPSTQSTPQLSHGQVKVDSNGQLLIRTGLPLPPKIPETVSESGTLTEKHCRRSSSKPPFPAAASCSVPSAEMVLVMSSRAEQTPVAQT